MKSFFFSCHMCGSLESQKLIPAILADGSCCHFQEIVICKKCGLVYKNPVIPELNKLSYDRHSWGDGVDFKKRLADLILYLDQYLDEITPKTILEIGPGPGWLSMCLQTKFPNSKMILVEPSEDVALLAKQNLPFATVVPSDLDDIKMRDGLIDLAVVCGVDYLFNNFKGAFDKIYSLLSKDGYIYIERNVFVEAEAYSWYPINSYHNLFGQNALMTTWFNKEQYLELLKMYFDVVSVRSYLLNETHGHKCIIEGYWCKKKNKVYDYYNENRSWFSVNMKSLDRLSKGEFQ